MKIHEYQAKSLLRPFGVALLEGRVAYSVEEACEAAEVLGGEMWVVKAQIHAGGRGKGGGIKIAKSLEEVKSFSSSLLGMTLVTPQTGLEGKEVGRLYIEQGCKIAQELYVSLLVDRVSSRLTLVASVAGGIDIEEVAAHSPEKIHKLAIDPLMGFHPYQARLLAFRMGLGGKVALKAATLMVNLYKAFLHYDASLIEINPMVITHDEEVIALDAKMVLDENALYRQPHLEELRDPSEEDPSEAEAARQGLSYVKLDGNIGCLVNGAGLAMATMDVIKLSGGEPANFLDVGGGAPKERVVSAFKLILADVNVEGILVNIFGGIMRCDIIAEGIVAAAREVGINVPLVVRLEGTNVDLGKKILQNSDLKIIPANDLGEAAQLIVKAVKEAS